MQAVLQPADCKVQVSTHVGRHVRFIEQPQRRLHVSKRVMQLAILTELGLIQDLTPSDQRPVSR